MKDSLHYLSINRYRLFQLRYFIGVLFVIYLLSTFSFMNGEGGGWAYFSIHDRNALTNNMHWFSFNIFPLLVPFNFFGHVLVQESPFEFVRIRHPRHLFVISLVWMAIYSASYVFISILFALFFQADKGVPLAFILSLFIHLVITLWSMLILQTTIHCLGYSILGLVVNLVIIVHSFYSQVGFKWIMTDPSTQMTARTLLVRFLMIVLITALAYSAYWYQPRLKMKAN